ncbi:MAG TPA: 50S ribosomal protein L4 [Candidatus Saccharimonadales bacterium]|jgi:large subunit ribosomal protein L4|nr:50S ribosomal protein L4 [Candidatus Saccharimonadales bacterium]
MATPTTDKNVTLPKEIFAVEVKNHELLKLAYDTYLANGRQASAKTKNRGDVSGGGKKPWKQKGTGRARFGSSRNPIWRGGGIAFGPTGNQNFTKTLSVGAKRVAVRQALSLANKAGKIMTVAEVKATGKTKDMAAFLETHKVSTTRRVLLVVDQKTPELLRSTANIENLEVIRATYLNVYYILNADKIVLTTAAVKEITDWLSYGGNK